MPCQGITCVLSGGQYHWVYVLAPSSMRTTLSYIVGWQSVLGWQAATASTYYLVASILQGLFVLTLPDYDFHRWHATLLLIAFVLLGLIVTTLLSRLLPHISSFLLIFHIVAFIAVVAAITSLAPKTDPSVVFGQFLTDGGYSSRGVTFFVGVVGSVFAFLGKSSLARSSWPLP